MKKQSYKKSPCSGHTGGAMNKKYVGISFSAFMLPHKRENTSRPSITIKRDVKKLFTLLLILGISGVFYVS